MTPLEALTFSVVEKTHPNIVEVLRLMHRNGATKERAAEIIRERAPAGTTIREGLLLAADVIWARKEGSE